MNSDVLHEVSAEEAQETQRTCQAGQGSLPSCAPLAVPIVPAQGSHPDRFSRTKALRHGTLFPALDLPFHLKVRPGQTADTPLNQLRALEFVQLELGLYLDTHPNDQEAFALFQKYTRLAQTARADYVKSHGPMTQTDAAQDSTYTWGNGPWPWNYEEEES